MCCFVAQNTELLICNDVIAAQLYFLFFDVLFCKSPWETISHLSSFEYALFTHLIVNLNQPAMTSGFQGGPDKVMPTRRWGYYGAANLKNELVNRRACKIISADKLIIRESDWFSLLCTRKWHPVAVGRLFLTHRNLNISLMVLEGMLTAVQIAQISAVRFNTKHILGRLRAISPPPQILKQ